MKSINANDLLGLMSASTLVVASNAPATIREAALEAKSHYGALIQLCDGTADNVEIQAAIDALPSSGGRLVLSSGIFNLAGTITLKSYVTLQGQNRGRPSEPPDTVGSTVLVQAANFTPLLNLNATDGVMLRDFKIRGGQGTYATGRAIQAVGADWLTIENLYLNGIVGEGIYGEYSGGKGCGWSLRDIYVRGGGAEGVYFFGIVDAWLDQVVTGGCAGEAGIYLRDGGDLVVKGCRADWNSKRGFYINGGSNITLASCTADANNYAGFELLNHSDSVLVGLRGFNNGKATGGVWQYGVGIRFAATSLRNILLGSRFQDSQGVKTQQYGILEDETSNYNIISENDVIGNGTKGIYLPIAGANTIVRSNQGHATENSGQASITGAVNSVNVTHNLASTPTRVLVTAIQTGQGDFAVTAKGAATFTITFVTQPGASTWYFDWRAVVGEGN